MRRKYLEAVRTAMELSVDEEKEKGEDQRRLG